MSKYEEAIRHFEEATKTANKIKGLEPESALICDNIIRMNEIALTALGEKAERDKGCEWCDWFSAAKLPNTDEPVTFCSHCGRRLKQESKGEER